MATSGALADFGRLPPERKALVFIVIGALLGLVYFQFVFKSLNSSLDDARTQHETSIATSAQLTNDIPKYDVERQHMKQLKQTIDENQKALPTEAELPAFYETLNRKILESGVELSNWAQKPEQQVETFVKVPIDIEISGTFLQLKRFFASLVQKDVGRAAATSDDGVEERERIVSIENLSLSSPVVKNGSIVLTAKFTAATFRQEDPAAAAAGSGAGSGAAPAAPATPGQPKPPPPPSPSNPTQPAPPPMPSASTPAGAKAHVEQSLDKGAARNANATGVDEAKTPQGGGGSDRLKGGM